MEEKIFERELQEALQLSLSQPNEDGDNEGVAVVASQEADDDDVTIVTSTCAGEAPPVLTLDDSPVLSPVLPVIGNLLDFT